MFMTRQQELQEVRHMVRNEAGLNWFEKACRYLVLGFTLIVIAVVGLPAWIFHGRSRNMWAGILNDNLNDDGWIQQFVVKYIMYDPLTFLGMPKAWRKDVQNKVDALVIGLSWYMIYTAASLTDGESSSDATQTREISMISNILIMILSIKCSKTFSEFGFKFSAFIYMLGEVCEFCIAVTPDGVCGIKAGSLSSIHATTDPAPHRSSWI